MTFNPHERPGAFDREAPNPTTLPQINTGLENHPQSPSLPRVLLCPSPPFLHRDRMVPDRQHQPKQGHGRTRKLARTIDRDSCGSGLPDHIGRNLFPAAFPRARHRHVHRPHDHDWLGGVSCLQHQQEKMARLDFAFFRVPYSNRLPLARPIESSEF